MSLPAQLLALFRRRLRPRLGAFHRDEGGQIALMFALGAPAVVLLAVGAIDLSNVQASRVKLQDIAEAAALAGGRELGLAIEDAPTIERAQAFVTAHLSEWKNSPTITPHIGVVERDGRRVIEVILNAHSQSFFANMLPPGGWNYKAEARAVSVSLTPLCVLVSGASGSKLLNVNNTGRIQAPDCLVHSNRDIAVDGGSITALQTQAVTSAYGTITPAPGAGAAKIEDPFADMDMSLPANLASVCSLTNNVGLSLGQLKQVIPAHLTGTVRLSPGVHCGGMVMLGNSELILEPGEHWFIGERLIIGGNARLTGSDVVLFFDTLSGFDFIGHSTISLEGRKSGPYAGVVLAGLRTSILDFTIASDHVDSLLGVIYMPSARLVVSGNSPVARDSAWTVIVAKSLKLIGSPSLMINADYTATTVPVPTGVGPRGGGAKLIE
ncbi:pilus assembly protein [soil metagenome]